MSSRQQFSHIIPLLLLALSIYWAIYGAELMWTAIWPQYIAIESKAVRLAEVISGLQCFLREQMSCRSLTMSRTFIRSIKFWNKVNYLMRRMCRSHCYITRQVFRLQTKKDQNCCPKIMFSMIVILVYGNWRAPIFAWTWAVLILAKLQLMQMSQGESHFGQNQCQCLQNEAVWLPKWLIHELQTGDDGQCCSQASMQ